MEKTEEGKEEKEERGEKRRKQVKRGLEATVANISFRQEVTKQ